MKLVAISGSLRAASFNSYLLVAAQKFLPEGISCTFASIADVPLYNSDIDGENKPVPVVQLKETVVAADGLLIATPEYNYGIPGGLKNALDWLSRPAYKSVLAHKPVAIMSASQSPAGGVRAQGQLKQVLSGVLAEIYRAPEFVLPSAQHLFNDEGVLIDEEVATRLNRFVTDYVNWIAQGLKVRSQ